MARAPGIKKDPALTAADRLVRRINTRLEQTARRLGTESAAYGHLEQVVSSIFNRPTDFIHTESGAMRISRSRENLSRATERKAEQLLKRIERLPTVKQEEERLLKQFTDRTGFAPSGRAGKKQAIEEQSKIMNSLRSNLENKLGALYDLIGITGDDDARVQIRSLSKGRWTSAAEIQQMIDIADKELQENEDILRDYYGEEGIPYGGM